MFEVEIGLIYGDVLNFDKSFLHFNVKEKNIFKELLEKNNISLAVNIEY